MRKRSISLLLVLLLLLETVSMTVYAKATVPEMPYYVAIGDSIASGYGLRGNETE